MTAARIQPTRSEWSAPAWKPRYLPVAVLWLTATLAAGQQIRVLQQTQDPYGFPRPGPGQTQVPLRTSFYLELGVDSKAVPTDSVLPESVEVRLHADGGPETVMLKRGGQFEAGYSGRLFPHKRMLGNPSLAIYIDSAVPLKPSTPHTVRIAAQSRAGAQLAEATGTWQFTTEPAPATHAVAVDLDLAQPTVSWRGGFFTGFCKPSFCTSLGDRIPTYELMDQVRRTAPKAWSLQRDFWMTGMEHQPEFLSGNLPNIVRERETRRITAMTFHTNGVQLRVDDFFGHEQYGIASGRPLSADYHAKDEVLIADGVADARAEVVAVDEAQRTVLVTSFPTPSNGWKIAYSAPLPETENPVMPGRFPAGGCYLLKFKPAGTPHYYWGRLDQECDLAHRRFRRRLMPNFADAPGDLSVDGRNWTQPKDYVEYHDVVRAITSHFIERYGAASLDFVWSVFNEPDLGAMFWRAGWDDLQRFYDYTVDGILRAFEDHGYDSERVVVGGLELGAIFGPHLRLREFLVHCSPRATGKDALERNAAFADPRLEGRRSRRVETLCGAHNGKGSPCDFVSIHAYNRSEIMAAKLVRAKEMALEVDAEYYARLWINSHESCPNWNPPPDPAASDSYLGNGYFPTWCADVARRLLQPASKDPRYGYGESLLTFWPWPSSNFTGANDSACAIHVDDNGDGVEDRTITRALPILHFLGLLARMGDRYWVLPERIVGGHVLSGFASRAEGKLLVLLYSHHPLDTQSRSAAQFEFTLKIQGLAAGATSVTEHRFDQGHNSYFRLAKELRDRPSPGPSAAAPKASETALANHLADTLRGLEHPEESTVLRTLAELGSLGATGRTLGEPLVELMQRTESQTIRIAAEKALKQAWAPECYPAAALQPLETLSQLQVTRSWRPQVGTDGTLPLTAQVMANGAVMLIVHGKPARPLERALSP